MSTDPFAAAFRRVAPPPPDPPEARARWAELGPGFKAARRRHRIKVAAGTGLAVVSLAIGGAGLLAAVDTTPAPTDFAGDTSDPEIGDPSVLGNDDTSPPAEGDTAEVTAEPDGIDPVPLESVGNADDVRPPDTTLPPSTTAPPSTTSSPAPTSPTTVTTAGGLVTVQLDGSTLAFVAATPTAPYDDYELGRQTDHEVRVKFKGPGVETQVSVELENGNLETKVVDDEKSDDEQDDEHDDEKDDEQDDEHEDRD
ncbi:MAG: hypothetical protein ACE5GB_04425 [Acidimicrobiales bacterium]